VTARLNRPLILASLLLAAFASNLDTTIVNVAVPTLVTEFDASNAQLEWIVDAYNLVFAALVLAAVWGASTAFFHSFGTAPFLAAGVAATGAVMALVLIPPQPPAISAADPQPSITPA
jgi:MFS family permease